VCCSVLQYVAVCCSVLQYVAAMRGVAAPTLRCLRGGGRQSVLQSVAVCCSVLLCGAVRCSNATSCSAYSAISIRRR